MKGKIKPKHAKSRLHDERALKHQRQRYRRPTFECTKASFNYYIEIFRVRE